MRAIDKDGKDAETKTDQPKDILTARQEALNKMKGQKI